MKNFLFALALAAMPSALFAQFGVVEPLHVQGNQLNDRYGNKVVLHGVMDTPNPYFNRNRWGYACNDNTVSACINYFDKLFTGIASPAKGSYCNIFRLHLDPCWTNDPGKPSTGSETGEANISRFSASRLQKYLNSLYWPIAKKAIGHGLYVVIRPPGVCPKDLRVGDAYQEYLKTVWNIVSSNANIKNNSGIVSLELANEPVHVYNRYGQGSASALKEYFQPIVDIIRRNGYKGILWIPGTGYQSQYESYASNPIQDNNFGYAVHVYPGWYGASDKSYNHNAFIQNFKRQVPIVTSKPILVSEIDWSPERPGSGKYNEFGQWVASNYGTWGTACTSKWGNAWKAVMDYFGNISMTLSSTEDYLDIDHYLNTGNVKAAFGENTEACAKTCFYWYYEYSKKDYAHASGNTPVQPQPQPSQPSDNPAPFVGPSGNSMIPAFSAQANYLPANWKVVDNGGVCTAGEKGNGPRQMTFDNGSDFTTGLYIRTISANKDGYAEYGSASGNNLFLGFGNYLVNFNVAAWTGNPYLKCEIITPSGKVLANRIVKCSKNLNRKGGKITGTTNVCFSFYAIEKGDYRLRLTPVADEQGNKGDWQEVVVGNVGFYSQGNPLVFSKENTVPKGWTIVDANQTVAAGEAGIGPRIFKFNGGGDFTYGLYIRQSDASKRGYAEYGNVGGCGMTLLAGSYYLTYNAVAWQGTPYMKCEVLDASNKVIGSQIIRCDKNVDRNLSASTAGSSVGRVVFNAPTTGYYHFRWTPVADAQGNSGAWLEAVIGHIKITNTALTRATLTSGISEIVAEKETVKDNAWYTLQGAKLNGKPQQRGIYIHNGKKIIVR